MFVVLLIALGGIGTFAIWRLSRPRAPRLVAGATPSITKIGRDGFWIGPHTMSVGAPLRYRYMDGGRSIDRTYIIEEEGRPVFIYTGQQPLGVQILAGAVAGAGMQRASSVVQSGGGSDTEWFDDDDEDAGTVFTTRDPAISTASAATSTSGSSCSSAGDTSSASSGSSCSSAGDPPAY